GAPRGPEAEGVRAARVPRPQQRPAGDQVAHHRARVEHPFRQRQQRRRSAHQRAAQQDRPRVRSAADPHDPRRRLHPDGLAARVRTKFALRTRLTVFYTVVFGLLLMALAAVSYRVLDQQLDSDATASLLEMTNGLHGYLHFGSGKPEILYDSTDPEEAAFVQRATRFYQIYDATTGALLAQSEAIAPLGLAFTPAEVKSFRDQPRLHDVQTDYGRIRLTHSVSAGDIPSQVFLLQVGASLAGSDGALRRFLQLLLWGMPAGLLIAVVVGRWMAGVALAPLERFAA